MELFSFRGISFQIGSSDPVGRLRCQSRELVPTMPAIYIIGSRADEWPANGVPGGICISKPFVEAQIITATATLLNQSSSDPSNEPGGS
ncbi:hypothetical protein [Brucella intermedia]|uniref:hypothetical protein n=1 Tax=Brucella intermedia TaxID=94625 RepID=UPI001590C541|nr:hypothetical protein [Brucella intermedia]